MTILATGYSFLDFTNLTELFPRVPKLLEQLDLFNEDYFGSSTIAQVQRVQDGVDAITAQARGGDRNFSGGETAIQRNFNIPFFPLDTKWFTAADIQDMKDFTDNPNVPMTVEKRMERARNRLARSHSLLQETARYSALKGASYAPTQGISQYDYATEFSVTANVATPIVIDFASGTVDPRSKVEEGRAHIQQYAGNLADSYEVICICGTQFFNGLRHNPIVVDAYKFFQSEENILRDRLGGNMINRSLRTDGVLYIEDSVAVSAGLLATDEGYLLPRGIADMFQMHYAPADMKEYANTPALAMYMFLEETPRKSQVQTETSFLCVNTRPELVVKLTGTF